MPQASPQELADDTLLRREGIRRHPTRSDGAGKLHRTFIRARSARCGFRREFPRSSLILSSTAIGLDSDQVKVNVTLMGGGFGRASRA